MLGELNDERMASVGDALARLAAIEGEDPALRAARDWHAVGNDWDGSDDDAAEKVWRDRFDRATRRLIDVPARTPRGLAAKLRIGVEDTSDGPYGTLVDQVISQLERMA